MNEAQKVYLMPGESFASKRPFEISTLLGSCVAVCLYDERGKFGGMNHYMLPSGNHQTKLEKYGDYSIQKLYEGMLIKGSRPEHLTASVIGGAAVTSFLGSGMNIAEKNIKLAFDFLSKLNLNISLKEVGGHRGRRLSFQNWNNKIEIKKIQGSQTSAERVYEKHPIRILVVDDSKTLCKIYKKALSLDAAILVEAVAHDAFIARDLIIELNPDVILLDIIMPNLNGIDFLKRVMEYYPKPIIVVSSVVQEGTRRAQEALEAGAFAVVDKTSLDIYKGFDKLQNILIPKIKAAVLTHKS